MTLLPMPDICVVGRAVIQRSQWKFPLDSQTPYVEFSSFSAAVMAVRLLKRDDWLIAAELTLDDEDFLTLQVLVRRLKKGVAGEKFRNQNQLSPRAQSDKTGVPSLEDLL